MKGEFFKKTITSDDATKGAVIIGGTWRDTEIPVWMKALRQKGELKKSFQCLWKLIFQH
jgi:hypothetical protein